MPRPSKYNIKCKLCNKPLEWYRGRPKTYCPKCLLITQRKNGLKYYYKNREKKLAYSKTYRDNHKKEMKYYKFSKTISGNTKEEALETFISMLHEYKSYQAFEIKEESK